MGGVLMSGEFNCDDGKLPGRLAGEDGWGEDARLLLLDAGVEGWLGREVPGVARELGGCAALINFPCASREGRVFFLLGGIHKRGVMTRGQLVGNHSCN